MCTCEEPFLAILACCGSKVTLRRPLQKPDSGNDARKDGTANAAKRGNLGSSGRT